MRTLKEDLTGHLDEVSRAYIRKPITVILSIFLFILCTPLGILQAWTECWKSFTVPCWKGYD